MFLHLLVNQNALRVREIGLWSTFIYLHWQWLYPSTMNFHISRWMFTCAQVILINHATKEPWLEGFVRHCPSQCITILLLEIRAHGIFLDCSAAMRTRKSASQHALDRQLFLFRIRLRSIRYKFKIFPFFRILSNAFFMSKNHVKKLSAHADYLDSRENQ